MTRYCNFALFSLLMAEINNFSLIRATTRHSVKLICTFFSYDVYLKLHRQPCTSGENR